MSRRKRHTWQPNEITSIIRSSQDPVTDPGSSGSQLSSSQPSPNESMAQRFEEDPQSSPAAWKDSEHTGDTTGEIVAQDSSADQSLTSVHLPPQLGHHGEQGQRATTPAMDLVEYWTCGNTAELETTDNLNASAQIAQNNEKLESTDSESPLSKPEDQNSIVATPSKGLKRTSSMVRLSMSLDGKASVVLKGNTPSPPSKRPAHIITARSGLQRSQSMLSGSSQSTLIPREVRPALAIPRMPGRSRDARTWEFYCDSDVRESLTKTAYNDQRGSAAGPIQLIRSGSANRQALASTNRQSVQHHKQGSSKRKLVADLDKSKPKLARTASSYARLQGIKESTTGKSDDFCGKPSSQPALRRDPSGDSDKENWEPGSHHSNRRPKTSAARVPRTFQHGVLQESEGISSQFSSVGTLMEQEKLGTRGAKRRSECEARLDKENEQDDEKVSKSLGATTSVRGEDDLDVVQSLLSLSQGAWQ